MGGGFMGPGQGLYVINVCTCMLVPEGVAKFMGPVFCKMRHELSMTGLSIGSQNVR